MIINYLIGGLGNQLFQIAAGYSHSLNMKTSYAINYNFNLGYGQGNHPSKYKNSIFKKIKQTNRNFFRMYDQPGFAFSTIPLMDEICLRGYFQSEKYFKKNETAIRNLFKFPDDIKIKVNNKNFKFNKKKNIGIHLRRGDYLNLSDIHPPVTKEYILSSLRFFDKSKVNFLVFSDDINKVKKEFNNKNFRFINNDDELEDLYALSQCDSIIMSNSSFSWWANWLGKKKEKTIAPKIWFGPKGPTNTEDLYHKNWTIL